MRVSESELKSRFEFTIGIRFELIYSLALLQMSRSGAQASWVEDARSRMSPSLREDLSRFEDSPFFWILVGDAVGSWWDGGNIEGLLRRFDELDPEELRRGLLVGAIHDAEVAERVLAGAIDLATAVKELPAKKREWLEHIDIYPPTRNSPTFAALRHALSDPRDTAERIARILRTYHESIFASTWQRLRPGLSKSLQEKQRLFEATSLDEFFRLALIRVEVDSENQNLRALRGGYTLPYERLEKAYVIPSFFNHHRYWTGFAEKDREIIFLPYFDHEITLDGSMPGGESVRPVDVTLIFKALGDPTRVSIASLIARKAMSSAELAEDLGVTRPTISHHVMLLREAGLLEEETRGGSVYLSLNKRTLDELSSAALARFFGE